LAPNKKEMHILCCNGMVVTAVKYTIRMFKWSHIAVGLNLTAEVLYVMHDDLVTEIPLQVNQNASGPKRELSIQGGGRLVVGQRLYSLNGSHHILETLDGEIADYRIYDIYLTHADMNAFLTCKNPVISKSPLIDLENGRLSLVGEIWIRETELSEICSKHTTRFFLFFVDKLNFHDALEWCKKLQGDVIVPQDPEVNQMLFHKFSPYSEKCQSIWTYMYWIGIQGNLATTDWERSSDRGPVDWYNFLPQYKMVTSESLCVAAVSHSPYKWAACPCDMETCTLCNFTLQPIFRMRGLCKTSLLDRSYSFRENDLYHLEFDGTTHTMIIKENNTWVMRSRLYHDVGAKMLVSGTGEYPVGVHMWEIYGDRCDTKMVSLTPLLLTACNVTEFTCHDGSCIPKISRCDMAMDCKDQSDEINCTIVLLPFGYSEKIAPPTSFSEPLPVLLSLNIRSIREFDLVAFRLGADMLITTKWIDERLKFKNLRPKYRANKMETFQDVWIPRIRITDGTQSAVAVETYFQGLYVTRVDDPLPDDDSIVLEDKVYDGINNMMVFEEEETLTFMCQFTLRMYPFDRQMCFVEFIMHDLASDFGIFRMDGSGIAFTGERILLEYQLISETFTNYTKDSVSRVK
ncbi:hypothetical protein SK128_028594, partial [Halocaridina rubra]